MIHGGFRKSPRIIVLQKLGRFDDRRLVVYGEEKILFEIHPPNITYLNTL